LEKYQEFKSQQPIGIQEPVHIHTSSKIGKDVFVGAFAYISENVIIADGAKIYPGVFIGNNVVIGKNTTIHAGVKIYFDCQVGDNVIIHAGSVIGSDGFGFAPLPDGSYRKVPQIGNVVIGNGVEIGANVTIDRATIGSTIINKGVKIDNLVQVAHNVQIDEDSVVAAQTGISGSTKIGKKVMIGGQTGIVGHITIADGSKINGKSGITKSITKPNMSFNGIPATDFTSSLRSQASLRRLPDLEKKISELESAIKKLMEKNN
jgi:UDP-3-O-[3-hydroxymyristoyl] glucosamine N-acyltransferase